MKLRNVLFSACVASAVLAAGAAHAAPYPDFKVDPTAVGTNPTFTADKITGNYVEVISFGAGTFDISLLWQPSGFSYPEGAFTVAGTGINNSYALYATYKGSGTFTTGSGGSATFTLSPGGQFNLYRDALAGAGTATTFTAPALGSNPFGITFGSDGADSLLATGSGLSGLGNLACSSGLNCGSFGQDTSFNLTAAGKKFFVDPVPFYNLTMTAGQFNGFTPSGTLQLNGSLDAVFASKVPEPGTIALVGISLVGLGIAKRKKNNAA